MCGHDGIGARPVVEKPNHQAPSFAHQSSRGVEERPAQILGSCTGQCTLEAERLEPPHEIGRERHHDRPALSAHGDGRREHQTQSYPVGKPPNSVLSDVSRHLVTTRFHNGRVLLACIS